MARIRHPDLGVERDVPARTVRIWARSGWKPVDRLAEIVRLSEEAGLYDDPPTPLSRPAPAPLASRPAVEPLGPVGADLDPPTQED